MRLYVIKILLVSCPIKRVWRSIVRSGRSNWRANLHQVRVRVAHSDV